MKSSLPLFLLLLLAAPSFAASPSDDAKKLVLDNNRFACDLYAKLQGTDSDNLFFSPYSISTALGMTLAGASGETKKQMATVLHFDLSQERLHPALKALAESLKAGVGKQAYELRIANALWGQKGYEFKKPFLDLTVANYGADLKLVDFKKGAEDARKTINAWVEKETQDRIKELLKPGILDDQTRLVLTNAIYFKGTWRYQFKVADTRDESFYLSDKPRKNEALRPEVKVPFMSQTGRFRYLESNAVKILELPYGAHAKDSDQQLSMLVLLPRQETSADLSAVEKSLTADAIQKWAGEMKTVEVHVSIPKFQMTCYFSLVDTLKAMGMKDAFGDKADFSGMSSAKPPLYISAVVHKAFVDVNEEGTEAAAATGVAVKTLADYGEWFRADHPFLFLIRDNATGSILFLGRCLNPTK